MELIEYIISYEENDRTVLSADQTDDLSDWISDTHKAAGTDTRECSFQSDTVESFSLFQALVKKEKTMGEVADRLSEMLLSAMIASNPPKSIPKCRFTVCLDISNSAIVLSLADYNKIIDETHTKRRGPAYDKRFNRLRSCVVPIRIGQPELHVNITGTQDYWIKDFLSLRVKRTDFANSDTLYRAVSQVYSQNLTKFKADRSLLLAELVRAIRDHGQKINPRDLPEKIKTYHPVDSTLDINALSEKVRKAIDKKINKGELDAEFNSDKDAVKGKHATSIHHIKNGITLTVNIDDADLKSSVYRLKNGDQEGIFIPVNGAEGDTITWEKPVETIDAADATDGQ
ncbi:MAG: hypothetical protein RRB13_04380 [bacterium]|nr:hypothetical protein [bacterium]